MLKPRVVVAMLSTAAIVLGVSAAYGQDYPNKPIRLVASTAGGGGDFTARLIAPGLAPALGQPVIVDNRSGSVLASEAAAKAPPDGYTLLVIGSSLWVTPLLQKVPYDVVRDFSPVSAIAREVGLVAVHPSLPVKSIKDLIALAKARPGELNYSFASPGSSSHLGAQLFTSLAGINIVGIPYKGNGPAATALIGGEVQLLITDVGLLMPHARSGKLRALAVTSATPTTLAPGMPTVAASGLPGYEATTMTGLLAPAKTPRDGRHPIEPRTRTSS
jgi:tripartite-type tricarboxylate transporter receptor subunit TctC